MPARLIESVAGIRLNRKLIRAKLEDKLRAELDGARVTHRAYFTKVCSSPIQAGKTPEVYEVEDVESFTAQLQLRRFAEANVFGHGEINAPSRWPLDNSAAGRANLIGYA